MKNKLTGVVEAYKKYVPASTSGNVFHAVAVVKPADGISGCLVKAEHHVAFNADGSTLNRMHALVFSVQKSNHDQTIIDRFMLGNSIHHGEQTVPAVYEHVRRFMEEGGPRLPPGEMITNIEKPASFMQCMARSGPYGENFKKWWKNARFLTIIWLFFSPITIPIFTLLGIFSWLSYSTSISISWPAEVLAAIGPELNEK